MSSGEWPGTNVPIMLTSGLPVLHWHCGHRDWDWPLASEAVLSIGLYNFKRKQELTHDVDKENRGLV